MTKQQSNHRQSQKSASSGNTRESKGDMSVRESGHRGGQRVRELIGKGKQQESRGG